MLDMPNAFPPPASPRHVLIVGGGIAGPALALFLAKAGIRATIYEAHGELANIGGAICIAPNGMNVLAQIGLADRVADAGTPITSMAFHTPKGRFLGSMSYGRTSGAGRPAIALARSTFQAMLLAAAAERGIAIHYGKRLATIDDDGTHVSVRFEDGTQADGDLLIGADGIRSRVRRCLLPDAPEPAFTGLTGAGGFLPRSQVPAIEPRDENVMHLCYGTGAFIGYACGDRGATDGAFWWYALARETPLDTDSRAALMGEAGMQALLHAGKGWSPEIRAMLAATTRAIPPLDIYDMPSLPLWWAGRVALIGDAAHAVSPHSGQGVSMALEDAIIMARELRDAPAAPEIAFEAFVKARRERTEKVIAFGRLSGNSKRHGPVMTFIQSLLMPLFLRFAPSFAWVYDYKVAWDETRLEEKTAA
ncbi:MULTISPECIES: NAD(P)/FAD-dependent oxidoreductase [unclassified Beijerinckia]|uniref:FAD-dependent oxidoreductase n=1 Tax=unclassified Beijerinckia TaxID=2638183 RepID=UPI0008978F2E|nr:MULTISPECIES: NAD(P)/FAD-dependent oxidoreductase [unclassified Beijerinckia]MDH7794773.1 2-polyprenyl-6-methoxyphenol hydroxylase-like FAD-dependent oxidoreductase [Beijerinckia sp. GAS462]SEB74647.1 2-polyprenyl-6-methoxyphenol hydroxylase [Beijerinckia sp. 28-YEA-48]